MKRFAQKNFNRYHIVDILRQLSSPSSELYLAVNILESMQITSVCDAVEDKLSIYDDYINNKLKYVDCVPINRIEDIMKSFLIEHCTMANELFLSNADVSAKELVERCSVEYLSSATTAKCIFSFLYIVSIMKRIMHPTFKTALLPYSIENLNGIGKSPLSEDDNEFFFYFKLDVNMETYITNAVIGAFDVLLYLADDKGKIEYCVHMTDETPSMDDICYIFDYTEKKDTLRVLNHIFKDDATLFYQVNNNISE